MSIPKFNIGDKVKVVKGDPFGKIGVIKSLPPAPMKGPVTCKTNELDNAPDLIGYEIVTEDGGIYTVFEDQLELIKGDN